MINQHHNQDHTNHSDDDNFEALLTKHLQQAQTYLPDDDFTARVMQQLPAPKKLSLWQERLIILIPLVVISVLVLSQFSLLAVLIKLWTLFLTTNITSLLQIGALTTLAVVSGAAFWFARQCKVI
jgi:hypothetical protein